MPPRKNTKARKQKLPGPESFAAAPVSGEYQRLWRVRAAAPVVMRQQHLQRHMCWTSPEWTMSTTVLLCTVRLAGASRMT